MSFKTIRTLLPIGAFCALVMVLATAAGAGDDEKGFKQLFNGKNLDGFKTIVRGKSDPAKTFYVEKGVIVVTGRPTGFFCTTKSYRNYVLRYDWKFSNKNPRSNSGLLVHMQNYKVWPKCIEVQGAQGSHGSIFGIGGAPRGKFKVDSIAQRKAIKPGEWNTTEVVSRNGMISSKINGIPIASGKGTLTEGPFGFQSEGTKLYFKNIRIKVLD